MYYRQRSWVDFRFILVLLTWWNIFIGWSILCVIFWFFPFLLSHRNIFLSNSGFISLLNCSLVSLGRNWDWNCIVLLFLRRCFWCFFCLSGISRLFCRIFLSFDWLDLSFICFCLVTFDNSYIRFLLYIFFLNNIIFFGNIRSICWFHIFICSCSIVFLSNRHLRNKWCIGVFIFLSKWLSCFILLWSFGRISWFIDDFLQNFVVCQVYFSWLILYFFNLFVDLCWVNQRFFCLIFLSLVFLDILLNWQ